MENSDNRSEQGVEKVAAVHAALEKADVEFLDKNGGPRRVA